MIDLRSDTVTRPTPGMRKAMHDAEVGDDVFGDDPTVNKLQAVLAERLGFEAGLFMPSGTMSNLCALMAHCQRGEEYLVGQKAHTYKYEAGGAAVLGSVQPQPLPQNIDGSIPLEEIEGAVKPDDPHFARTRLLALENTFWGHVLSQAYVNAAQQLARTKGLNIHLDGARLFNAAVASGADARELVKGFDSVSICLSKGLGTPAGSVLLGTKELIARAHRHRKILGGAMRQAGVLAAAGLYALDHHIARLAEDHARAKRIAVALSQVPGLTVPVPETNIVLVHGDRAKLTALMAHFKANGILSAMPYAVRLVTHLDISDKDVERIEDAVRSFAPIGATA